MINLATLLFFGTLAGLSIGATIGPIALLCVHRSMSSGFLMGLVTGLGATVANMILSSIAVFCMSLLTLFLKAYESWIQISAGIVIIIVGITLVFTPYKKPTPISHNAAGYTSSFFSAFLLNVSTPISISSYASFIALFHLEIISVIHSIAFLLGVLIGNIIWWLIVSAGSVYIYRLLEEHQLKWINVISGLLLTGVGCAGILVGWHRLYQ